MSRSRGLIPPGLCLLLLAGCATSNAWLPPTYPDGDGGEPSVFERSTAQRDLDAARELLEADDRSRVVPRLLSLISKYPNTPAAREAHYYLGVTYYDIASYRDAEQVLEEYLRMAPAGPHAEESERYLALIQTQLDDSLMNQERLAGRIQALQTALAADPDQLDLRWELADLLWRRGNYEAAARIYVDIAKRHPELADDPRLTSRVEVQPSGMYVALTPAEIQRRDIEEMPLVIANLSDFQSGRRLLTHEEQFYVVSGQAINRGDSTLYGVEVNITIYGFGNVVFESKTVSLGRLLPGESRAFSVRFSTFEEIENVWRYEATGSFLR
jgi:tetratricopeptide (TPR) repeat protein